MTRVSIALAALLLGSAAGAEPPAAPDPVAAYPDDYRVLLENERVRVLDFRLAKGQPLREARPHQVSWSEPTVHASENVGASDAHGILVELKPASCPAE